MPNKPNLIKVAIEIKQYLTDVYLAEKGSQLTNQLLDRLVDKYDGEGEDISLDISDYAFLKAHWDIVTNCVTAAYEDFKKEIESLNYLMADSATVPDNFWKSFSLELFFAQELWNSVVAQVSRNDTWYQSSIGSSEEGGSYNLWLSGNKSKTVVFSFDEYGLIALE